MMALYVLGAFCTVFIVEGMFYLIEKVDKEIRGA